MILIFSEIAVFLSGERTAFVLLILVNYINLNNSKKLQKNKNNYFFIFNIDFYNIFFFCTRNKT